MIRKVITMLHTLFSRPPKPPPCTAMECPGREESRQDNLSELEDRSHDISRRLHVLEWQAGDLRTDPERKD